MSLTFAGIVFTTLISSALPLAALILLKIKNKTGLIASAVGAAGFFIFALVLESLLHKIVLPQIANIPWLYVIYGCLASGIFEESSRFIGFKLLKRFNKASLSDAFAYGLGHGGIEAFLIVGLPYILNLPLLFSPNGDLFFSSAPAELYWIAGIERLLAMSLHFALTLLVWLAAVKRETWLVFVSVLLHAFANSGSALSQIGAVSNYILIYVSLVIAIAVAVVLFIKTYKKHRAEFKSI